MNNQKKVCGAVISDDQVNVIAIEVSRIMTTLSARLWTARQILALQDMGIDRAAVLEAVFASSKA